MVVKSLVGNGVELSLRAFVKVEDYWTVFFDLKEQIKLQFYRYGLAFQIPRMEVEMTDAALRKECDESSVGAEG